MQLLNGFTNLKDIVNQRVVGDIIPVVTTAIDQSIAEHNAVTEAMMKIFVEKTNKFKLRYRSPAAASLQPLDEVGRARKIKAAGFYDLGFPLRSAGAALGSTRVALIKKTVQEVNDEIALLLDADKRWLRDQIFAALFNNTNYSFPDEEHGDLGVKALANQDGTLYLIKTGAEAGEESNNYRGTLAMNDADEPFYQSYLDLTRRPENFGDGHVISFIPGNLESAVLGLSDFVIISDPDLMLGANTVKLTGSLNATVPGIVLGKAGRNWIVRWDALPDNYIISTITSGDRPLAMREHPEAELQGFNRVSDGGADDPYYESQYIRHAGFGAYNRVGAIITKVGSSTYDAPPTGFSVPMNS